MVRLAPALAVLACVLASPGQAPSKAATAAAFAVFQRAAASVYVVRTFGLDRRVLQNGSGVAVSANRVITNFHMVDGAATIELWHGDHVWAAHLDGCAPARDLCRLAAPGLEAHAAALVTPSLPRLGEAVYALNASLGKVSEMSTGAVTSIIYSGGEPLIESSAAVRKGKSGGGLFDAQARLIGITEMPILDRQSESYAIPIVAFSALPEIAPPNPGMAPAIGPLTAPPLPAPADPPAAPAVPLTLAGVHSVCIAVSGTSASAETASALLASQLARSRVVAISENCALADAVLKGSVEAPSSLAPATIELRLVVGGGAVVWGDAEHSSGSLADDALHDVVQRGLRRLTADLDRARKTSSSSRQ